MILCYAQAYGFHYNSDIMVTVAAEMSKLAAVKYVG